MKLATVTVRNFRSYVTQQGQPTPTLTLGDGINLLVGPNNCGKSNLLRAVSLALEDSGGSRFDPAFDIPSQLRFAYPVITLGFRCEGRTQVEKTLLRFVREYERSAGVSATYADNGEINLRVMYRTSGRDESFAVKGAPNKKGDEKKLERALSQFRKCIRFIYLRSGESLNNFLSGAFKELLHTVLLKCWRIFAARFGLLELLETDLTRAMSTTNSGSRTKIIGERGQVFCADLTAAGEVVRDRGAGDYKGPVGRGRNRIELVNDPESEVQAERLAAPGAARSRPLGPRFGSHGGKTTRSRVIARAILGDHARNAKKAEPSI